MSYKPWFTGFTSWGDFAILSFLAIQTGISVFTVFTIITGFTSRAGRSLAAGADWVGFSIDDGAVAVVGRSGGRGIVVGLKMGMVNRCETPWVTYFVSRSSVFALAVFRDPLTEEPTTLLTDLCGLSILLEIVHLEPHVPNTDFAEVRFCGDFRVDTMEGDKGPGDDDNGRSHHDDRSDDGTEGIFAGLLVFSGIFIFTGFEFVVGALHDCKGASAMISEDSRRLLKGKKWGGEIDG